MKKSTSLHVLNNDNGLSRINKIRWFAYNIINNSFPKIKSDPDLSQEIFQVSDFNLSLETTSSPSRRLCDIFWHSIPWASIAKALNDSVKVLEVGCGSGIYGNLINNYLNGRLKNYIGIDIKKNPKWGKFNNVKKFKFVVGNANSVSKLLTNSNLVITQSALEHFNEDITFFRQIVNYNKKMKKPMIQIHLMPSGPCLYTFLWHGVRQYTPRTISKITKLFDHNTKKYLYCLGNKSLNKLHQKYITIPRLLKKDDQRYLRKDQYNKDLSDEIIKYVNNDKQTNHPSFYALVLQSNIPSSKQIFL